MNSSITTNDLNDLSQHEKSTYDNLTNSLHYPLHKKSHQQCLNEEYDNYPMIISNQNQNQNSLGIYYIVEKTKKIYSLNFRTIITK